MSNETHNAPEWMNAKGIYDRFALPRSLLRSLVDEGTVHVKPVETRFGMMNLYKVADCVAFMNGETEGGAQ